MTTHRNACNSGALPTLPGAGLLADVQAIAATVYFQVSPGRVVRCHLHGSVKIDGEPMAKLTNRFLLSESQFRCPVHKGPPSSTRCFPPMLLLKDQSRFFPLISTKSRCLMAQAVSRRPFKAEALVQSQASATEVC